MHMYNCLHCNMCIIQINKNVLRLTILDAGPLELAYVEFKCVMEDNTVQIIQMKKTAVRSSLQLLPYSYSVKNCNFINTFSNYSCSVHTSLQLHAVFSTLHMRKRYQPCTVDRHKSFVLEVRLFHNNCVLLHKTLLLGMLTALLEYIINIYIAQNILLPSLLLVTYL